ncbi:MAG: DUF2207 domain-containing protein, partial [Candidatus Paceibacterota bacterium]
MRSNSSSIWQKVFFKSIIIVALFSIFSTQVQAKEYSINSLTVDATIQPDGSMTVTEQRVYDFRDDFAFAYQYLYHQPDQTLDPHRSEPYEIRIRSLCDESKCYSFLPSNQVDLNDRRNNIIDTFTVAQDAKATYIQWHFSAIFEPKTFTLSYTVDNAVTIHEDAAELYWQFVGSEWEAPQRNILITVNLPEGIEDEQIAAWMHEVQGGVVSIVDNHTVTFQLDNNPTGKFTEGRIIFPREVMTGGAAGSASRELIVGQENEFITRTKQANQWVSWFGLAWTALTAWLWFVVLREVYRFVRHDIQRIPPANQADRFWEPPSDLEPALVEQLLTGSKTISARAFTATALSLVQQKVMRILRSDKKKGFLVKDYEYGFEQTGKTKKLSVTQQHVFDHIFTTVGRGKETVWFTELIKYSKNHSSSAYLFLQRLGKEAFADNLEQGMFESKQPSRFFATFKPLAKPALAAIGLFAVSIVLPIFNQYLEPESLLMIAILSLPFQLFIPGTLMVIVGMMRDMPRRTTEGLREASLWRAFKKHMEDYKQT